MSWGLSPGHVRTGGVAKRQNGRVRVSAKADYAIRAAVELAAAGEGPLKGDRIAQAPQIPSNFLENIPSHLPNAPLSTSRRGAAGGLEGARIAQARQIPSNCLETILSDLRNAGLVNSRRGAEGGYWLARRAGGVSHADMIRAVDRPLAIVRGIRSAQ